MQLTLENKFATYYPPKSQLLKWVGNKQRFAVEITKYFPTDYGKYFEPFLGSGAVLATMAPRDGLGSDTFGPLMEIWMMLKNDPKGLVAWYAARRNKIGKLSKEEVYENTKASYNKKPNGADFVFLSRACYGGIVRFRKSDGYMSTPCGAHMPIPADAFARRVEEWKNRLRNVSFALSDYKEAFAQAKAGDLVYCDPPYFHSQSILYGAQEFRLTELLEEIEKAKIRGVNVALSIDGHKKSGNYICDISIPLKLFEREIYVDCGRSMLRRFQLEGQTLESEIVADRLLLTY
jgi:DNA adenine methylase